MAGKISLFSSVGKMDQKLEGIKNTDDLKKKLAELKIDLKGMAVIDVNTETEYKLGTNQELPEGDLQLYILPAQTKSGLNF